MAVKAAAIAKTLSIGLTAATLAALAGLGAGEPDAIGAADDGAAAALELAAAAPTAAAPGLACPGLGAESFTVLAADGLLGKLMRTVSFLACGDGVTDGVSAGLGEFSSAIMIFVNLKNPKADCQLESTVINRLLKVQIILNSPKPNSNCRFQGVSNTINSIKRRLHL